MAPGPAGTYSEFLTAAPHDEEGRARRDELGRWGSWELAQAGFEFRLIAKTEEESVGR